MIGREVSLSQIAANANVTQFPCVGCYFGKRANKSCVSGERSGWEARGKRRVLTIRLTSKRGVWPEPAKPTALEVFGP